VTRDLRNKLLDTIVDNLDIPKSYYLKAVDRHNSLGEWLCRPESKLSAFKPKVHSQGSFRYGTVVRPLCADSEYDLDNVTTLQIEKTSFSQKDIKELYGAEIRSYAKAYNMTAPVEEKNRCWRLRYSDEVAFHLDALPCIPEDPAVINALVKHGVPKEWAQVAVAITDKRHPEYERKTRALFSSNPRGFAKWFEQCVRPIALNRIRELVNLRMYTSVEDVPPYEWKTPLQRSIQILKRHRDVMFRENSEMAPISMIITNLAAHAYEGEKDLWAALTNVVEGMPKFIRTARPRVPNPADPAEDYADRWAKNPFLESNFWSWHTQVSADLEALARGIEDRRVGRLVRSIFSIDLTRDELSVFENIAPAIQIARSAPAISIPYAPRPWGKSCKKG
jgi:hypothetical protein